MVSHNWLPSIMVKASTKQGNIHAYLSIFFFRPAFRCFTVRIKDSSRDSRNEFDPNARPLRSWPRTPAWAAGRRAAE